MVYVALFFISSLLFLPSQAVVNPQKGENLWQLTRRIGETTDEIQDLQESFSSQLDDLAEDLSEEHEMLEDLLESVNDILCSKLEIIDGKINQLLDG